MLALCCCSWAASKPTSYPITVHVTATHWFMAPSVTGAAARLDLSATISGKKYEMEASLDQGGATLLRLGDYPAALIRDTHKTSYEFSQTYQLLMPDGTKQNFDVIGESE
jgi:hypothetical protein